MGDGAYWIWQAGCDDGAQYFSHTPSDNPVLVRFDLIQDWNFNVGDVVTVSIEYASEQSKEKRESLKSKEKVYLKFQKEDQVFKALIELSKEGFYYPCVALGDEG